jgi:hypothetical protein
MIKKSTKALGVATATLSLAGALLAPQAMAQTQAERVADATAKKTAALEVQVNQMASMMQAMQTELSRVKATAGAVSSAKVLELDQWMASVKNAPAAAAAKDNKVSVRGGFVGFNEARGAASAVGGAGTDILTSPTDEDGFYFGGAIDMNVNNDLFGLMDGTSFAIELGFEYSEIADDGDNGLDNLLGVLTGNGTALDSTLQPNTVNMLRISAAPKIKLMHGSKLRPWVIPMGLEINVIGVPSDAVSVMGVGMLFGAGVDYDLIAGISLGLDGRYHWSPDDIDGVETDGYTLGGSVGFAW